MLRYDETHMSKEKLFDILMYTIEGLYNKDGSFLASYDNDHLFFHFKGFSIFHECFSLKPLFMSGMDFIGDKNLDYGNFNIPYKLHDEVVDTMLKFSNPSLSFYLSSGIDEYKNIVSFYYGVSKFIDLLAHFNNDNFLNKKLMIANFVYQIEKAKSIGNNTLVKTKLFLVSNYIVDMILSNNIKRSSYFYTNLFLPYIIYNYSENILYIVFKYEKNRADTKNKFELSTGLDVNYINSKILSYLEDTTL